MNLRLTPHLQNDVVVSGRKAHPAFVVAQLQRSFPRLLRLATGLKEDLRGRSARNPLSIVPSQTISQWSLSDRMLHREALYAFASTSFREKLEQYFPEEQIFLEEWETEDWLFVIDRQSTWADGALPSQEERMRRLRAQHASGLAVIEDAISRLHHIGCLYVAEKATALSEDAHTELLKLHAIRTHRSTLEEHYGVRLAFQLPDITAVCRRDHMPDSFREFCTIEGQIMTLAECA